MANRAGMPPVWTNTVRVPASIGATTQPTTIPSTMPALPAAKP